MMERVAGFFKLIYIKLVRIDDTPHKIAVGLGLGVFAGVMPFAGPLVAVFLAIIFKANKISAFLGGLLTNTWITIAAFFFSIRIGAFVFGIDREIVRARWMALMKDFHFSTFFKLSVFEIMLPVITGYLVISFVSAVAAYIVCMATLKIIEHRKAL